MNELHTIDAARVAARTRAYVAELLADTPLPFRRLRQLASEIEGFVKQEVEQALQEVQQ